MRPPTFACLDVSTAHLSPEEAAKLREAACPIAPVFDTRYGWMVYAGERGDDPEAFDDEAGDWPGLLAARKLAQEHGCRFVWFDADAAKMPGLPEWSW